MMTQKAVRKATRSMGLSNGCSRSLLCPCSQAPTRLVLRLHACIKALNGSADGVKPLESLPCMMTTCIKTVGAACGTYIQRTIHPAKHTARKQHAVHLPQAIDWTPGTPHPVEHTVCVYNHVHMFVHVCYRCVISVTCMVDASDAICSCCSLPLMLAS